MYILDSSVLMEDSENLYCYGRSNVLIPFVVLEELDNLKESDSSNKSYRARKSLKEIEKVVKNSYKLGKNRGKLLIEQINYEEYFIPELDLNKNDNKIIYHGFYYNKKLEENQVFIVSNDLNLRLKCSFLGINSMSAIQKKKNSKIDEEIRLIKVNDENIDKIYKEKKLSSEGFKNKFYENQPIIVTSDIDDKKSALCVYKKQNFHLISDFNKKNFKKTKDFFDFRPKWAIPKNKEQKYAYEFLFDKDIPLVTMTGLAGTGKTLLTISSALYQTLVEEKYKKIVITRSIQPMGKEIGYLPGKKEDKMESWIAPIKDNLEYILGDKHAVEDLFAEGIIEVEAPTFIRGRSISDAFFIIDEAQNMSLHEIKTIVTRVGHNTKVVFIGDVEQIDDFKLTKENNGLSQIIEKMKEEELSSHVVLKKGERSPLATISSKLL